MEPLLLTPKEAARALGLSQSYVYELLAREALPSITIGRTRRIPRRALEAFVEACSAEMPGIQRVDQGVGVNDGSSRGVHQQGPRLHHGQFGFANQVMAVGSQFHVN